MRRALAVLALPLLPATPAIAQARLTVQEAVAAAMSQSPAADAAAAAQEEAAQRIAQARAGYLPRLELVESWQRGNQPVFAFGALLAQRRFSAANFAIDALNHPEPVDNFRTGIVAEQLIFDGGRRRASLAAARAGHELAEAAREQTSLDLAAAAVRAYGHAWLAIRQRDASEEAVRAADDDLSRAEQRRDAGLATEADVLALRVHRARAEEAAIEARGQVIVARAELNRVMGAPLDLVSELEDPAPAAEIPDAAALEASALASRPELTQAALQVDLAGLARESARAAFFPQVGVQGGYEFNGGSFDSRAGSWIVGAELRWTLFSGLGDVARAREAAAASRRAEAEREERIRAVGVEIRRATAELEAALARRLVGRAAVLQARESQRIVRDRYEAGLATINDLLRAAVALTESQVQEAGATADVLIRRAQLDRAAGRLPGTTSP